MWGLVLPGLLSCLSTLFVLSLLFPVATGVNRVKFFAQALSFPVVLAGLGLIAAIVSVVLLVLTAAPVWVFETLLFAVYTLVAGIRILVGGLKKVAPTPGEKPLVIMGWNTLGDSVPVEYMRDVILAQQPDAVGLPETTQDHVDALVALLEVAGYRMTGYNVGPKDGYLPHETSLLIKADYGMYEVARLNILGASTLEATPVDPAAPTFVAVHTVAPTLDKHAAWVQDLKMLTARYTGAVKTVLVGDFNATALHMRNIDGKRHGVLGGLEDAASTAGNIISATWPVKKPILLGAQIDHVLYTPDFTASKFTVHPEYDNSGSDHRVITARLECQ